MSNTKKTEELGVNALNIKLLRCPFLHPYINMNDKTPSWDGNIIVYKNANTCLKKDILGRVPVQVKSTEEQLSNKKSITLQADVVDLKNYSIDGGVIYFLISIDIPSGAFSFYYASLLTYELNKILKCAGNQDSCSIPMKVFPSENYDEVATIFFTFIENRSKQMNLIGKEIPSLMELEKGNVPIESLSFSVMKVGKQKNSIESFLTMHDFYLYAKIKGTDIDVLVDKVSNAVISKEINGSVVVEQKAHYSSYSVIYERQTTTIKIGSSMLICFPRDSNEKPTVTFQLRGTLNERLKDIGFFIDVITHKVFSINAINISIMENYEEKIEWYQGYNNYLKDVKRMLDLLGVNEELQCDNLQKHDEENIRNLVLAVLYNRRIGFDGIDAETIYGPFQFGNLEIQLWGKKHEDGYYNVESFFENRPVISYDPEDETKQPIPTSCYVLLRKEAFVHSSNMDYSKIYNSLVSTPHSKCLFSRVNLLMLEMLKGYDIQTSKDSELLDLAERICIWIKENDEDADIAIITLNLLQIAKRRHALATDELVSLAEYRNEKYPINVRCGAFILLEDKDNAQKCFDEMDDTMRAEFQEFPICHFI